jgi:hypothetical protein
MVFFQMQELSESVSVAMHCKKTIAAQGRGPQAATFFADWIMKFWPVR